jgi:putative transposase
MLLAEQVQIEKNENISSLCHRSKNLWNAANWYVRQEYFYNEKVLFYEDLDFILKSNPVYKALPAQCSQQTLKLLGKSWKSFFAAMKEWKIHPFKFKRMPRPPKYKERDGETIVIFTNQQCGIAGGYLHFPPRMESKIDPIKTRLPDDADLREVRVVPAGTGYTIEIVYERPEIDLKLDKENVASIDIGLTNIVTIVNNIGEKPIVVKGGAVKSINQFYNKRLAKYRSILAKQDIFDDSKRLKKLHRDRNNRIKTAFHRISKGIVDYLVQNDIGSLAIGYNEGWKQRCRMQKDVKQQFIQLPFAKLVHQIEYKCKLVGIDVTINTESYTSKASFLDGDAIPDEYDGQKHVFSGRRLKRGIYRSGNGILINADVNGGYNIGKKAFPNAFVADGIEGAGLHPKIVVIR